MVEADLQQFYGTSLVDLSLRRAWVLIRHLPVESRFVRKHNEAAVWSNETYLLAVVADQIADLSWLYASTHSKSKVKRPKPLPRPGAAEDRHGKYRNPEGRLISGDELIAMTSE